MEGSQKQLILNADDFGSRQSVNQAVVQAFASGVLTSTSLMTPCAWAFDAMNWLSDHLDVPFGIHLTLVRDYDGYRWGPVSSPVTVPSLVDGSGFFPLFDGTRQLAESVQINEVEQEFRAQIERALGENLRPSHLDWHCLPDGGREDVFLLTVRLAREYGLAMRTHRADHRQHLRDAGLPVGDHDVLDSYLAPPDEKREIFRSLLRDLPGGRTEWAMHPGIESPESRAIEPESWRYRTLDLEFLCDPKTRRSIDEHEIQLVSFRDLQAGWAADAPN
jgi:predicted glycoside hydrolase/deacetylase ChbG (UPF0249 family)